MTPQIRAAKRLYPDGITTVEFAKAIGKSTSTVTRWRKRGMLTPTRFVKTGQTTVWLYSPDDIETGKRLSAELGGR